MPRHDVDLASAGTGAARPPPAADGDSLSLDARELALLREALTLLASPLESADVDQWRSEVNRVVRQLFQADRAVFLLPGCDAEPFQSNEYDTELLAPYVEHYRDVDEGLRRVKAGGHEVFCRRQLFDGELGTLQRTECYNDFLAPHGIEDSLGLLADPAAEMAGLWVHNERFGRPNAGERGLQIARLLLPVFKAGAALRVQLHPVRDRLGALLDTLEEAAAIVDAGGAMLHANPPLRALLDRAPVGPWLEQRIRAAAAAALALERAGGEALSARVQQRFTGDGRLYDLRAVRLQRPLDLAGSAAMVVVGASAQPPTAATLRDRFGLTRRQTDVAVLLWHGKTNQEIADQLTISPHTARRHTEKVLLKLGIHSRNDVREAVAPASGGTGERKGS